MDDIRITMRADLLRSDMVRGLVWFVNYAALDPTAVTSKSLDLHNTGMLPADVELFAHRWLSYCRVVDIQHDGKGRPVYVTESFFNSPTIASAAFPINSHCARLDVAQCQEAFDGLRSGKLNSVSLDALTINRTVRLPVATSRSAPSSEAPQCLADFAEDLARKGFEGVVGVRRVAPDLFVAMRSNGLPVAVAMKNGELEASGVGGGVWANIAATLYRSPTFVNAARHSPDFKSWDDGLASLEHAGFEADGPLAGQVCAVVDPTGVGHLPHHSYDGVGLRVSRDGVMRALAQVETLDASLRAAAREHLSAHLAELDAKSGGEA